MTLRVSNPVFFDVLDPLPLEHIGWEIRVFQRSNPNSLVTLVPRWWNLTWTKPLSDVGAASVEILRDDRIFTDPLPIGIASTILEDETVWKVYWNGLHRCTFFCEDVDTDHVTEDGKHVVKVSGRTTGKMLEHPTVLPPGYPSYTTKDHTWTASSVMKAWKDLFNEAKTRGTLPAFMTTAITDTADTTGVPWADSGDTTLGPGGNLLELLRRYSEVASVDWQVDKNFNVDVRSQFGNHVEDLVVFHLAGGIQQFHEQKTRRDVRTHLYVEGAEGSISEASDGTAATKWGRREAWLSAGDAADLAAAGTYAQSALTTLKNEARQVTAKVLPTIEGREALTDYDTGDWVTVEMEDAEGNFGTESVKIVAMTFAVDENGKTDLELTLSTRLQESLIRMKQALARLTGGSSASTATNSQSPIPTRQIIQNSNLDDLSDVDVTSSPSGAVLRRSGGLWVDDLLAINELDNVVIASPTEGQVLGYDPSSSSWKNEGAEVWNAVGAFSNGWGNLGGWDAASYRKDPLARVSLKGNLTGGTVGMAAFTLPAAYCPTTNKRFAQVDVMNSGAVIPQVANASLEGVAFFTD